MTKDGIRVEVIDRPAVGAGRVETPFGSYFTPLDTVAVVLTVPRTTTWQAELAANPMTSLLPVIGRINGDGRIADLLELTRNIELLWKDSPSDEITRLRAKEMVAASNALWKWGQRLNPVPEKLDRDERVEWLWERVLKSDGPKMLRCLPWPVFSQLCFKHLKNMSSRYIRKISRNTKGRFSATVSKDLAAPVGFLRPCSHS
ncbi:MAG: hypothetical protein H8E15_07510 [Planctomycetes bacterium]|nr:hypothetical protein [Planctomycetota bacterium]